MPTLSKPRNRDMTAEITESGTSHAEKPDIEVASRSGSESGDTSQSDENAPEALVRRENRAVKVIRILVILILVSATVSTS